MQGFGLSEMWRAPAAIMIRDVSPSNLGSTGSAVHLCVRNLIGGLGPLGAPSRLRDGRARPLCGVTEMGTVLCYRVEDVYMQRPEYGPGNRW